MSLTWSGHDFEAEHPFGRRLLHPHTGKRAKALPFEIGRDAAQHHRRISPGAAAGIEHIDVLRRRPLRSAEIVLQCPVHAGAAPVPKRSH